MPGMYKSRGMGSRPGSRKTAPKNGPAPRSRNGRPARPKNVMARKPGKPRGRMR